MSETLREKFIKEYWYWDKKRKPALYQQLIALSQEINLRFDLNEPMFCRHNYEGSNYDFEIVDRKSYALTKKYQSVYITFRVDNKTVVFTDGEQNLLSSFTYDEVDKIYTEIMNYVAGFQLQY